MRRSLFLLVAVSALLVSAPLAAGEGAGGANHVVLATATADGHANERSGIQVAHAGGPTVTSTNLAAAISYSCTGCRTVALAMQAGVMTGEPNVASPVNFAVATNLSCTSCTAAAFAYQYALDTNGPVHL